MFSLNGLSKTMQVKYIKKGNFVSKLFIQKPLFI